MTQLVLAGNEAVNSAIKAASGEKAFHAYIISGPAGTGKKTASKYLCAALECTSPDRIHFGPCGECPACRKVLRGIHPDVREYTMEGKENFLVGQSRELRDDAMLTPNEGRHKVYLLPDAAQMNEAASNALLKILEEPPDYAVFILISDNAASLPATIRSRCVEIRTRPVKNDLGIQVIKNEIPDAAESVIDEALEICDGSIGRAIDYLTGNDSQDFGEEAFKAVLADDEFSLLTVLLSLEKRPKSEVTSVLAFIAEKTALCAMGTKPPSGCRLTIPQLFAVAREANSLRDGSSLYISAGNYLAAAAARLYLAAHTV